MAEIPLTGGATTTPNNGAQPQYVKDNQQFKTVMPDGSLSAVTDDTVLKGLYGGTIPHQQVDQAAAMRLAAEPSIKPDSVNLGGEGHIVPSSNMSGKDYTPGKPEDVVNNQLNSYAGQDANGNALTVRDIQNGKVAVPNPPPGSAPVVPTPAGSPPTPSQPSTPPALGTIKADPNMPNTSGDPSNPLPGASGTPTPGAGNTGTGSATPGIPAALQPYLNPTLPKPVDANSPEIKQFASDKTASATTAENAQNLAYDSQMKAEIETATNNANQMIGKARNTMAKLGILDNSTYSMQYLNDLNSKLQQNVAAIQNKFQVLKMNLDAKTKDAIIKAINDEISNRNKQISQEVATITKGSNQALSLYKTFSGQQLQEERLKNSAAYNAGRITNDTYRANISAINAEVNARKKGIDVTINNPGDTSGAAIPGATSGSPGTVTGNPTSTAKIPKAKFVTKADSSKYQLPSSTPAGDLSAVKDTIGALIKQAGGVTDANRYVLWGKVSDGISQAHGDPAAYNAVLWEAFHPEGIAGYNTHFLGKPAKATSTPVPAVPAPTSDAGGNTKLASDMLQHYGNEDLEGRNTTGTKEGSDIAGTRVTPNVFKQGSIPDVNNLRTPQDFARLGNMRSKMNANPPSNAKSLKNGKQRLVSAMA